LCLQKNSPIETGFKEGLLKRKLAIASLRADSTLFGIKKEMPFFQDLSKN
jgi:hypothetical protein